MIVFLALLGVFTVIGVLVIAIVETRRMEMGKPSILPSATVKDRYAKSPKNKGTAVTLAVFFGPFAWLYIYSGNNKRKFEAFMIMILVFAMFTMSCREQILILGGHLGGRLIMALIIPFGYIIGWIWAVLDLALKPSSYYKNYWENVGGVKHSGKTRG